MTDITDYTLLVPSEHAGRPNFIAALTALVQGQVDANNVTQQLAQAFDLDTAIGWFLDRIGERVGVSRLISEPLGNVWFSWDISGLGWEQASWAAEPPSGAQLVALDDEHYRLLLKARVAANYWDGTIPGAYAAWETMFGPEGFQILIQDGQPRAVASLFSWDIATAGWDQGVWALEGSIVSSFLNGSMHIDLALVGGPVDALTLALFTGGYLTPVLKPAGVMIDNFLTQSVSGVPMFAWDAAAPSGATCPPTNLAGWDTGAWGLETPGS